MKLAIVGSRSFDNYGYMQWKLDFLRIEANKIGIHWNWKDVEIVSGGARGADSLAEEYADRHLLGLKIFTADWDDYGKSAGYKRNKEIVDYADIIIAFWNGESKGTKHTIDLANKAGKPCFVFTDWKGN